MAYESMVYDRCGKPADPRDCSRLHGNLLVRHSPERDGEYCARGILDRCLCATTPEKLAVGRGANRTRFRSNRNELIGSQTNPAPIPSSAGLERLQSRRRSVKAEGSHTHCCHKSVTKRHKNGSERVRIVQIWIGALSGPLIGFFSTEMRNSRFLLAFLLDSQAGDCTSNHQLLNL